MRIGTLLPIMIPSHYDVVWFHTSLLENSLVLEIDPFPPIDDTIQSSFGAFARHSGAAILNEISENGLESQKLWLELQERLKWMCSSYAPATLYSAAITPNEILSQLANEW